MPLSPEAAALLAAAEADAAREDAAHQDYRPRAAVAPGRWLYQQQTALLDWALRQARRDARLRELQPTAGSVVMPDLHLPLARGSWRSLYIALKPQKHRRISASQRDCHAALVAAGHRVLVCADWEAARDAVLGYLGPVAAVPPETEAGREAPVRRVRVRERTVPALAASTFQISFATPTPPPSPLATGDVYA